MPHTFEDVLNNVLVKVVMRDDSKGLFVIQLGDLPQEVEIQLGREMDNDGTHYSISHAIKTPLQAGPYLTSHPWGDYPAYALHRAVTGLTMYYQQAVEAGHTPNESWLVEC